MVVTMVPVREVQVVIHEIANVIAMRHGFVSASGSVHMSCLVTGTGVTRRAPCGIYRAHLDHMLIDVVVVHMMQMTVVELVDVIAVTHGRVAASRSVDVRVIGMLGVGAPGHGLPSRRFGRCPAL
jgi:hypothetical protein